MYIYDLLLPNGPGETHKLNSKYNAIKAVVFPQEKPPLLDFVRVFDKRFFPL